MASTARDTDRTVPLGETGLRRPSGVRRKQPSRDLEATDQRSTLGVFSVPEPGHSVVICDYRNTQQTHNRGESQLLRIATQRRGRRPRTRSTTNFENSGPAPGVVQDLGGLLRSNGQATPGRNEGPSGHREGPTLLRAQLGSSTGGGADAGDTPLGGTPEEGRPRAIRRDPSPRSGISRPTHSLRQGRHEDRVKAPSSAHNRTYSQRWDQAQNVSGHLEQVPPADSEGGQETYTTTSSGLSSRKKRENVRDTCERVYTALETNKKMRSPGPFYSI